MNREEYYKPCTKCGRPQTYCRGECCGTPKCKTDTCIRYGKPGCGCDAVIPTATVATKADIKGLTNCFVHVADTNTTFYVDDKGAAIETWAGLASVNNYDFDANPLNFRNQIVYDYDADKAAIYNQWGDHAEFPIGVTPESYNWLTEKPSINGVTLQGNKSLDDLGISSAINDAAEGVIDEMIEKTALVFDTVADMKASTDLVDGGYARTLGFYAINDGGGSLYYITGSGTANEKDVIAVGDLYAIFQPVLPVIPEQLGAYGDNTHDDSTIISYALGTYKSIKLSRKTYLTTSTITIAESNLTITGDYPAKIHYTGNNQAILINSGDRNEISNINILGNNSNIGIEFATNTGKSDYIIKRCRIEDVTTGIKTQYLWDVEVKDTRIINTNAPMILGNQTNNISFNSCYFTGFGASLSLTNCEGVKFDSCDIANYSGTAAPISLYQSALTIINCYFENLGNIVRHIKSTDSSSISIIGGHVTYNESTMPSLNIDGANGYVFVTHLQGAKPKIVQYYSSADKPASGGNVKSLNLPEEFEPSMFKALTYFDGTFDVTYTSTGTTAITNQTFADGVMTMQHAASPNPQGVKFNITAGKDYLVYLEADTPDEYPNLIMGQIGEGSSGTYTVNIDMSNKKAIVAFHAFGEQFTIRWNHTEDVIFRKIIIVEQ